eukprot:gb/GECG01001508.1/.p1 GENE.gb/GECG01001508.1/~~gb/GECG01001508.1/.p1  ORF type:complete len:287 (+),score=23.41 gb/GECG01001508.1/:1-861(+)
MNRLVASRMGVVRPMLNSGDKLALPMRITSLRQPCWVRSCTSSSSNRARTSAEGGSGSKYSGQDIEASKESRTTGPVSWASLGMFGVLGAAVLLYYNYQKERSKQFSGQSTVQSVGKALLGGPFELVDTNGRPVTEKNFRGNYHLIYFGFTYCPDICPNEMVKMGKVIDMLNKRKNVPEVVPIFISVDPYRDTVAQTREYLKDFHPKMIGLTGTPEQIKNATRAFRVYFSEVDHRDEDDDDYVVDHSIVLYLLSPDGEFIDFFPQMMEASEIAEKIAHKIKDLESR